MASSPAPSPTPLRGVSPPWFAPAVLLALAAILIARNPWMLTAPQFWNEDLWVFLREQRELGATALLHPYQGYLQGFQRLVAAGAALLPLYFTPWFYAAGSLAAWLWVGQRLLRSPLFDESVWAAIAVLTLGLMPQNGEVILVLTNAHWILAVGLAVLLVEPVLATTPIRDLAFAAVAALSGPFSFLFLPLAARRAWQHWRDARRLDVISVVVACGGIAQGLCVLFSSQRLQSTASVRLSTLASALADGLTGFLMHPRLTGQNPFTGTMVLGVLAIGIGLAVTSRLPGFAARRFLLLGSLILLVAGVAASLAAYGVAPSVQGSSGRYLFVPGALFFIAVVMTWSQVAWRPTWRAIPWLIFAMMLTCSARQFRAPRYPAPDWAAACRDLSAGRPVQLQAWPGRERVIELRPILR